MKPSRLWLSCVACLSLAACRPSTATSQATREMSDSGSAAKAPSPASALTSAVTSRAGPRREPAPDLHLAARAFRGKGPRLDPAVFEQHRAALAARLPSGFSTAAEPPFLVIGDQPPEAVARHARQTVRWARQRLEAQFFERGPSSVIDVWLFKDATSYRHHAWQLFKDKPDTPYGYYSPSDRALVMNIATGGGTLVHEMVHPYVEADFPDCPAWLNEGLGSLFEQSASRGGRIVGLTNWRLAGLQRAIRAGESLTFKQLTSLGEAFYDDESGLHYAQARYLCYYLQEQGKLEAYYRAFRSGHAGDASGYQNLLQVLQIADVDAFEARWRQYVLGLTFP